MNFDFGLEPEIGYVSLGRELAALRMAGEWRSSKAVNLARLGIGL